jgi:hypothetical protein
MSIGRHLVQMEQIGQLSEFMENTNQAGPILSAFGHFWWPFVLIGHFVLPTVFGLFNNSSYVNRFAISTFWADGERMKCAPTYINSIRWNITCKWCHKIYWKEILCENVKMGFYSVIDSIISGKIFGNNSFKNPILAFVASSLEFVPKFFGPILAIIVANIVLFAAPHLVKGFFQLRIGTHKSSVSSCRKLSVWKRANY